MLVADIRGKLTLSEHVSEDFLTSAVFSSLKYMSEKWLERFLQTCVNMRDSCLSYHSRKPEYFFWKWYELPEEYGSGAEPDLVILDQGLALVIECKFKSPKGRGENLEDHAPDAMEKSTNRRKRIDQLAREYFIGTKTLVGKDPRIDDFKLIYVTNDPRLPTSDVEESLIEIERLESDEYETAKNRIFWTNWDKLVPVLREISQSPDSHFLERNLAGDLLEFLDRRNITYFSGFDFLSSPGLLGALEQSPHWFSTRMDQVWTWPACDPFPDREYQGFFHRDVERLWAFGALGTEELTYTSFYCG